MSEVLQERFQKPKNWHWGKLLNARGDSLRYGTSAPIEKPMAHVVFVEGFGEFAEKSFELARDFNRESCAFWALDRKGQGLSARPLKGTKASPENVHDDTADLIQFVREVVSQEAPVILQGNSAGGLLSLMAMHDAPDLFSGAVLTAPLLGLQNRVMKKRETLLAQMSLPRLMRERYLPGNGEWRPRESPERHKAAAYSSDPDRMVIQDYWQTCEPGLRVNGCTWDWLQAQCRAMVEVRKPAFLSAITQPVEIFTAGCDFLINNDFTARALPHFRNAVLHHVPQGRHELLMETDAIRMPVIAATVNMARQLAPL